METTIYIILFLGGIIVAKMDKDNWIALLLVCCYVIIGIVATALLSLFIGAALGVL